MADARYSHGMILRHRVLDSGDYDSVAQMMTVNVPSPQRQKIVTTPHSSKYETSIAGRVVSYPDISFTINYIPSTEESQRNILSGIDPEAGDGRIDGWQVETPDGERWSFRGWLMTHNITTPEDDKIMADITIAITGKIVHSFRGIVTLSSYAPTNGDTLTATLSDPDGTSGVGYQWQRKTSRGAEWANISTATDQTYTVAAGSSGADRGAMLRCKVSYTDAILDEAVTVESPATAPAVA